MGLGLEGMGRDKKKEMEIRLKLFVFVFVFPFQNHCRHESLSVSSTIKYRRQHQWSSLGHFQTVKQLLMAT